MKIFSKRFVRFLMILSVVQLSLNAPLLVPTLQAQRSSEIDRSFNFGNGPGHDYSIGSGTNDAINAVVLQPNGKILIGGNFTQYNAFPSRYLVRVNADGSIDNSFVIGNALNSNVQAIALQADGKILVGGRFTNYNGIAGLNYLVRLMPNGSLDSDFSTGLGPNAWVNAIAVTPNGKIWVGGNFSSFDNRNRKKLILLEANGQVDNGFLPSTGVDGDFSSISTISVQSDGKALIGGIFESYNQAIALRIARINPNGSIDASFDTRNGPNNEVKSIIQLPSGKVLVAGRFTRVGLFNKQGLVRLNADGSLDDTYMQGFNMTLPLGNSISLLSDGSLIFGGRMLTTPLGTRSSVFRITPNGRLDTSFASIEGANDWTQVVTVQRDGKILIAGLFTNYNRVIRSRIARINPTGTLDLTFNKPNGADNLVQKMSPLPGGKILISGSFTSYLGVPCGGIAKLNYDGSLDSSFLLGRGANSTVNDHIILPDGKILIAGAFTRVNGRYTAQIAQLHPNGEVDTTFEGLDTLIGSVYTIARRADGRIAFGGDFFFGQGQINLGFLDPSGRVIPQPSGFGANIGVNALAYLPDGKLLVGGAFTNYNRTTIYGIMRLDTNLAIDRTLVMGTGLRGGAVFSILPMADGRMVLCGTFNVYAGRSCPGLVRIMPNGEYDRTFQMLGGANGPVYAVTQEASGTLLIGGDFTSYDGFVAPKIARINNEGRLDVSFRPIIGPSGLVRVISLQDTNKVLIGGDFDTYDNLNTYRIVRVWQNGPTYSPPAAPIVSENASLILYPNPSTHSLTVKAEGLQSIHIVNAQGKEVLTHSLELTHGSAGSTYLQHNLPPGMYWVKVLSTIGNIVQPLCVK